MKKKKQSKFIFVLATLILTFGLLIFLYPIISNYLAKQQQEKVIIGYEKALSESDENLILREWKKAIEYNENHENYMSILNIEGDGVMGYIEIPKIDVRLPVYHGSGESSLKKGVGHIEQTELPIGGMGNHPVLTGHRGLPNAELFTRLDEMEMGDIFYIHVLDEILAYEVSRITIVLPEEIGKIEAKPNEDLITLVTCTPYGVNTHRLLITGERTEVPVEKNEKQEVKESRRNKIIIYIIILFTGIAVFTYPYISNKRYYNKVEKQKTTFLKEISVLKSKKDKLYEELVRRNEEMYLNKQENFSNISACEKTTINLKLYGIKNNIIGFVSIPKMKIELPILLGASEANMKKGAVHLTETSYPIGGKSTNCVIAAHRGYSKAAMFREIEKLEIGDKIFIQNFKEKLIYKVTELRIIAPTDVEQVMIREGKDMITLITCHPYKKNYQRYVVFCKRI